MDIVSHGLWAGVPFYKKSRRRYWAAFLFGILPDLLSFGPHFLLSAIHPERNGFNGRPPLESFPQITFTFYNITHSFIIFLAVFFVVFFLNKKKFLWEMSGWGLHILMDIPTHSFRFFPTPFLWPFSSFKVNGFSWGQLWFIALNYSFIALIYLFLYFKNKRLQNRLH